MPFDPFDREYLEEHFDKHGFALGAATTEAYEQMADRFFNREPVMPPLHECFRRNGMRCVFDTQTEEYGVVYTWGTIVTYFKPVAAGHLPEDKRPEGAHEYRTNWEYFQARCR